MIGDQYYGEVVVGKDGHPKCATVDKTAARLSVTFHDLHYFS
jgi:hypothetical protein